jgi:hypothetical protein
VIVLSHPRVHSQMAQDVVALHKLAGQGRAGHKEYMYMYLKFARMVTGLLHTSLGL